MGKQPESLTIGTVAQRTGLRPSALRYYESIGLLPAPRRVSGQRLYDAAVFPRIRFVQAAQRAGFSLAEMKALLDGSPTGHPYAQKLQEMARRKLVEVQKRIADAQGMQRMLEAGLACRCDRMEDCLLFMGE